MSVEDIFCAVAALVPSQRNRNSVVALCYHRLSDHYDGTPLDRFTISRELLVRHLSMISKSGVNVIGPDQFLQVTGPAVMITFDDNLLSHVENALPVLADFGMKGTFFLNPAELDRPGLLTSSQVDTLLSAGMWVGAHSDDLNVVSLYSPDDFERQVSLCRGFLDSLGMPLAWAYPGGYIGSFHTAHDEILKQHGFSLRFSTLEMPRNSQDSNHVQGRYVVRKNTSDRYFRAALAGGLQLLRFYKKAKAKFWPMPRNRAWRIDTARSST